jgi:hypothetical protein
MQRGNAAKLASVQTPSVPVSTRMPITTKNETISACATKRACVSPNSTGSVWMPFAASASSLSMCLPKSTTVTSSA